MVQVRYLDDRTSHRRGWHPVLDLEEKPFEFSTREAAEVYAKELAGFMGREAEYRVRGHKSLT